MQNERNNSHGIFIENKKQKANDQSNSKRQREWGSDRFKEDEARNNSRIEEGRWLSFFHIYFGTAFLFTVSVF